MPHPARIGLLLLILPLHALLAVTLMDADPPVGGATAVRLAREAGVDPVAEQRLGAGLLWVIGDLVALAAVGHRLLPVVACRHRVHAWRGPSAPHR